MQIDEEQLLSRLLRDGAQQFLYHGIINANRHINGFVG